MATMKCPFCLTPSLLTDEVRGKNVRCPKCQEIYSVPTKNQQIQSRKPTGRGARNGDPEESPSGKKKSGGKALMVVGGIVVVLLLLCGGGAFGVWWWASNTWNNATNSIDKAFAAMTTADGGGFFNQKDLDEMKKWADEEAKRQAQGGGGGPIKNPDTGNKSSGPGPSKGPDTPKITFPANPFGNDDGNKPKYTLDQALADVKSGENQKRQKGADWFSKASVDKDRQAEVAKALDPLLMERNDGVRWAGEHALEVWATKDNVPTVAQLLSTTGNGDEQRLLMGIIVKQGDARGAEAIIPYLGNAFQWDVARSSLEKLGKPAEPAVVKAYHHANGNIRNHARALCRLYGTADAPIMNQTIQDLGAPAGETRHSAAEYLIDAKVDPQYQPAVARALEKQFNDEDLGMREKSVRALAIWGDKENVPGLIKLVEDPRNTGQANAMRDLAIDALGQIKDERAIPVVAPRLIRGNREQASRVLIAIGPAVEKELLKPEYSQNPDQGVRNEVAKILKAVGSKENVGLAAAVGDLKSDDVGRRRDACNTLGRMPKPDEGRRAEVAGMLEKMMLDDGDGEVRHLAAKAMFLWATPDNVPGLIKALDKEKEDWLRRWAIEALGELKDKRASKPLVFRLPNGNDREFASKALIAIGPDTEDDVIQALGHQEKAVRLEACKILGQIGTKKSQKPLNTFAALSLQAKQPDGVTAAQLAWKAIQDRGADK
jgi:HEAT repeat protein